VLLRPISTELWSMGEVCCVLEMTIKLAEIGIETYYEHPLLHCKGLLSILENRITLWFDYTFES